jgi:hypothetical protein
MTILSTRPARSDPTLSRSLPLSLPFTSIFSRGLVRWGYGGAHQPQRSTKAPKPQRIVKTTSLKAVDAKTSPADIRQSKPKSCSAPYGGAHQPQRCTKAPKPQRIVKNDPRSTQGRQNLTGGHQTVQTEELFRSVWGRSSTTTMHQSPQSTPQKPNPGTEAVKTRTCRAVATSVTPIRNHSAR